MCQARALDQHELKAGAFGYWHALHRHGNVNGWVEEEAGWRLQPVRRAKGKLAPRVPRDAAVREWVVQVHECEVWAR